MSKQYYHRQILCPVTSVVIARFSCPGAIAEQRHVDSAETGIVSGKEYFQGRRRGSAGKHEEDKESVQGLMVFCKSFARHQDFLHLFYPAIGSPLQVLVSLSLKAKSHHLQLSRQNPEESLLCTCRPSFIQLATG